MKYVFSEEDKKVIEKARRSTRDKQQDKRLEVLEFRCKGMTLKEIAEKTGYHRSHVSNLVKKYFEEGIASIAEKHYSGNRRNLSYEEEEAILSPFREKAIRGEVVEVSAIETAYMDAVGHSIGGSQIYYVLHRHGWRKIMPRSRHPKKASDEVIETSKKLTHESKS